MIKFALALMIGLAGSVTAETAIVAGGCFWCVEADFEKVKGVSEVVSGYTGGGLKNPTYKNHEGHLEAVQITFDPDKPDAQHAMPPRGFRLAIVNCWDLDVGRQARADLQRAFPR